MKKSFKTLLAVSLMLMGTSVFAQMSDDRAIWTAGGGFTTLSLGGEKGSSVIEGSIPGFYFGVSVDYAFSELEGLTVEPGVYILHYGQSGLEGSTGSESVYDPERSYHANYLCLPVNLKYNLPVDSSFGLALYTGPRFNLGLAGNMFSKGATYPGLKNFDAQWGFGIAATISQAVTFRAGYDLGLTKCWKKNDNEKVRHNDFHIGVGFAF